MTEPRQSNWQVRMSRRQGMNAGHNQTARVEYVVAASPEAAKKEAERRQKNYIAVSARKGGL